MSQNQKLINDYLRALSGQPKPPELVSQYVAGGKLAEHIAEIEAAFPQYEIVTEQMLGERDLVTVRGTFSGVHRGVFAGIEPTGREVSAGLIIIYRIENGRIAEHWMQFDLFTLLQQLQGTTAAVSA